MTDLVFLVSYQDRGDYHYLFIPFWRRLASLSNSYHSDTAVLLALGFWMTFLLYVVNLILGDPIFTLLLCILRR